jgi:hypothetical protein
MSRHGYCDDGDDQGALNCYRANVWRATIGKRGQKLLREMATALDAMPVKELVAGEIVRDNEHVCALGSVALARGLDVSQLDVTDGDEVGRTFGVASCLVREIAYENDEAGRETPAHRWTRMRAWVEENLTKAPATPQPVE